MGEVNGTANGIPVPSGKPCYQDMHTILDDWLFLVEDQPSALASAGDYGFNVDCWTNPRAFDGLKGKKVILVFNHFGEEKASQFQALGDARKAEPAALRIWKPFGLGDETTPDLRSYSGRYSIAEMLWWEKPWLHEPPPIDDRRKSGWPCTDMGNAERMASRYGRVIRYCRAWKKWIFWSGQRWEQDEMGKVNSMAKKTMRGIYEEAAGAYDKDEREMYSKWALKCEAAGKVNAMLQLVWSENGVPLMPSSLDPDPWKFNCPNGTIHLRTGELKIHDRGDLITRMSSVEFDPKADCPLWKQTVGRIFGGDAELISFVQRLFGMALTGDVSDQILPIFHGEGGNGKSTILNAFLDIMGPDYAIVAPPGLLFAKANEGHPTDKAALFGMRLVVDFESAEGARLNEALVKQLTGSDRISARRMREDFWTFMPTHKLILCTNNQPAISEAKNAIWRRLKLVPFDVEIPAEEQIADLPKLLKEEYPGILAWAVRGCMDWQRDGLKTPKAVQSATQEYREEEDTLSAFIHEECITGPSVRIKASKIYQSYRSNLDRSGIVALSMTGFGRAMKKKGFEKLVSNGKWYIGIDLRNNNGDEENGTF